MNCLKITRAKAQWLNLMVLLSCCMAALFLLSSCASLPPRPDLGFEAALPPAERGALADLGGRFKDENGSEVSGFRLLINSREAFQARLALIDLATRSIDLQYFIWKGDEAGALLFDRLLKAADRGVRVRIIVDDFGLAASTRRLSAYNSHPNLELRIFNPNPSRDYLIAGFMHFLAGFQELNRRMHNKLMIVDSQALVAGGRNIGNEYFGLGEKFNFIDVDVLSIGAVIKESSNAFDHYWNDNAVYPVSGWGLKVPENRLADLRRELQKALDEAEAELNATLLGNFDNRSWLEDLEQSLSKGSAHFLQDDPVQIDGRDYRLVDMISYFSAPNETEFLMSSPYLIPVGDSLKNIRQEVEKGVDVRILTNSLSSTNHTLVNSHYKKYRGPILDTGAELHEFKHQPSTALRNYADTTPHAAPFISLHAKVLVADRRRCFIGSLNFDPRAIVINSENGLLIESVELATKMTDFLSEMMNPENAWRLSYGPKGKIQWVSSEKTLTSQPARGVFQSFSDFFGRFLPVESQL
jgi:putative cardiolipin synthase